jgi:hypothetical protein
MQLAFAAIAALTAVILANPASAQPADQADQPMAGVAGYSHPEIGPDDCKVVNPSYTECVIPAKTAGRYLVTAAGVSTAKGDGATQTLAIGGKTWLCAKVTNTAKWSSGARTFQIACMIDVLSDDPVAIGAAYQDTNATKDPKGPKLAIRRVSWNGIIDSSYRGAQ